METTDELRKTARGVTADGMGSGSYAMFRCDIPDADLVFGVAARERALKARRAELEDLIVARQEANERMQESARLLDAVDKLKALTYGEAMSGVLALHREIRAAELLIGQLDVSEYQSLDARLAQLKAEELRELQKFAQLNERIGELNTRRTEVERRIERLSEQKDSAQDGMTQAEDVLRALHADWPEFNLYMEIGRASCRERV